MTDEIKMSDLNESISPLVILKDVALNHQEHQVLSGVNLQIDPGEFLYLIGKTGSGKSSLLRALYGDLNLASGSGEVCNTDLSNLNRRNVHKLRRKLGIVFQDFGLLTDRSVSDNLKFALKATGWRLKNEIKNRIDEVLETVGLPHKGYKFPHELSGGEQQRVAIARALLNSPDFVLADEPTGNLDPETTREILTLMHGLTTSGCSVIMATHDHASVEEFPGKILKCENGKIHQVKKTYESV
ncbi:MAG: cell division ATP-binding protein FtsE [Flavobacteriales bacterium]|jgi:cell division transport system ATP-binding protein|tara:strand:- start:1019 stop:1744 length:726 start_codon:yes stop_codon:yes gene_type:complete